VRSHTSTMSTKRRAGKCIIITATIAVCIVISLLNLIATQRNIAYESDKTALNTQEHEVAQRRRRKMVVSTTSTFQRQIPKVIDQTWYKKEFPGSIQSQIRHTSSMFPPNKVIQHNEGVLNNCGVKFSREKRHDYIDVDRTDDDITRGIFENTRMLHEIANASGVPLVIMHGSLIGWWWNNVSLPWDDDIDVILTNQDKFQKWLSAHTKINPIKTKKKHPNDKQTFYQLSDVNFTMYFDENRKHHIEYRLIHIPTGVYTDICVLYKTNDQKIMRNKKVSAPTKAKWPIWAMKANIKNLWGGHLYNEEDVLPFRNCNFNGYNLHCPNNVDNVLRQEYKRYRNPSTKGGSYSTHFNSKTRCWDKTQ